MAKKVEKTKRDLLGLTILSVPLAMLFFNPSLVDSFNFGKLIVVSIFSISLLLTVIAVIVASGNKKDFLRSKLSNIDVILFALLTIAIIISAVISTDNPYKLLLGTTGRNNGLLYYLSILVCCLTVLTMGQTKHNLRRFLNIMDFSSFVFVSYCLVQYLGKDPLEWTGSENPIIGTLGNTNFSSASLAGFSLYQLIRASNSVQTNNSERISRLFVGLMAGFLSWATDSIQGPVMIAVGLSIFVLSVIHVHLKGIVARASMWSSFIVLGAFSFVSLLGYGPLGEFLGQYTLRLRFTYAWIGLKSIAENLFFGLGVDSYLFAFRELRSKEFIEEYGLGVITDSAHSMPIQLGANFGAPVMILFLTIMTRVGIKVLKGLLEKNREDNETDALYIFWFVLFVQSLLSIEQIGLGYLLWILSAFILRITRHEEQIYHNELSYRGSRKSEDSFPKMEIFVVSIVAFLLLSLPIIREDGARKNLIALQVSTEMITEDDKAFIYSNFQKLSLQTLGDPILARPVLEKLFAAGLYKEIEEVCKKLVELNPRDYYAWEHLSTYYRIIDNKNLLNITLEKMSSLDPLNYQLTYSLALLQRDLGNKSKLEMYARRVIEIAPYSNEANESRKLLLK